MVFTSEMTFTVRNKCKINSRSNYMYALNVTLSFILFATVCLCNQTQPFARNQEPCTTIDPKYLHPRSPFIIHSVRGKYIRTYVFSPTSVSENNTHLVYKTRS